MKKQKMKERIDLAIGFFVIIFLIVSTSVGLWFFQGGDLRDLKNGCYHADGCEADE